MSARAEHLLQRSVRKLAVDIVRDVGARAQLNADTVLAEREEQVQLDLRGTATSTPAWSQLEVPFQHAFLTSNARRNSQLVRPHFTPGFELLSVSNPQNEPVVGGVLILPTVIGWKVESGIAITGVTVALCAWAPAGIELSFRAVAHLTFQGFGMPQDPEPDMEA